MKDGFYQVKEAVRWTGYAHGGSGGFFTSGINRITGLDRAIGFYDERLAKIREIRQRNKWSSTHIGGFYDGPLGSIRSFNLPEPPYSIPLIFRSECLPLGRDKNRGFVVSFFKKGEITPITEADAVKKLGAMTARRYGDLALFPVHSPEYYQPEEFRSIFPNLAVKCLENIPIWHPFTDRKEVKAIIKSDEKSFRDSFKEKVRRSRNYALLAHQVVGKESF